VTEFRQLDLLEDLKRTPPVKKAEATRNVLDLGNEALFAPPCAGGSRLEGRLHYAEKLLAAMGGSPAGWEYTGVVTDAGKAGSKCACEHPIRFEYHWKHTDGRTLITGSVCVEALPGIGEGIVLRMREDLERLNCERKEAARKAKLASEEKTVMECRDRILDRLKERFPRGHRLHHEEVSGWLGADDYGARETYRYWLGLVRASLRLKTPRGQVARLRGIAESLERVDGA